MAIGDRATASAETTGTSLTYAHSVAGSTDLCIWVCVDSWRSSGFADPTSVTYAAAGLTEQADFLGGSSNDNACSLWRKTAPATGSNNVVVTHSSSHDITAMSYSLSGVDQTTPNDAVQELDSSDADPTHSVTSETGDQVVSFIMGWGWGTLGEDGDLTIRLENNNTSGLNSIAVGDAPGAASVNASWTTISFNDPHGLFSFNVNAAAAGGPATSGSVNERAWGRVATTGAKGGVGLASLRALGRLATTGVHGAIGSGTFRAMGRISATGAKGGVGSATERGWGRLSVTPALASTEAVSVRAWGRISTTAAKAATAGATFRGQGRMLATGAKVGVGGAAFRAGARGLVVGAKASVGGAVERGWGRLAASSVPTPPATSGTVFMRGRGYMLVTSSSSRVGTAVIAARARATVAGAKGAGGVGVLRGTGKATSVGVGGRRGAISLRAWGYGTLTGAGARAAQVVMRGRGFGRVVLVADPIVKGPTAAVVGDPPGAEVLTGGAVGAVVGGPTKAVIA
jgi:hypothetical protein